MCQKRKVHHKSRHFVSSFMMNVVLEFSYAPITLLLKSYFELRAFYFSSLMKYFQYLFSQLFLGDYRYTCSVESGISLLCGEALSGISPNDGYFSVGNSRIAGSVRKAQILNKGMLSYTFKNNFSLPNAVV